MSMLANRPMVTYRNEQLFTTGQYENKRIGFEVSEFVGADETIEQATARVRKIVDTLFLQAVLEFKMGKVVAVEDAAVKRRNEQKLRIARELGLSYLDE